MRELIATLVAQQGRIFEMLQFDERPRLRRPVHPTRLSKLEAWFASLDCELPQSYRAFLSECDGIENFCLSYHLFGSPELLAPDYPETCRRAARAFPRDDAGANNALVLIGSDPETTNRLFFDTQHELLLPNELVVFDGQPGQWEFHTSFESFLEFRVTVNEITIARIAHLRDGTQSE
ncbi:MULTISPECIES: SMI1/KNR4 family protein [unclassified Caballeronia]|jgi:hypothetical protein|uniref:SMI1/KNR4 family protein n=1 Tax=unclassified Caballeronia TaxID=2646786 RepID=UPI002029A7AE|nr:MULTISPECIES: SMI1/KNR4 family protein [unclassified Caballeronia]